MGALIGTAIGVLPGVGPVATMALLLPVTYFLTPEGALIMLAGIYYGAQYGGSTTAILINVPGRGIVGRHCARRLRHGEAGPIRSRTRHRCSRLVLCRNGRHLPDRARGAAVDQARAAVRTRGLLLAHGARARARHRHGVGIAAESLRHDLSRHAAGARWHRRQHRQYAVHVRHRRSFRRYRLRHRRHGCVRHGGDHLEPCQHGAPRSRQLQGFEPVADAGRPPPFDPRRSCAALS